MRSCVAVAAFAGLMAECYVSAAQMPAEVDLELVLAVDVSYSMGFEEQRVQRDGYVAAFRSPQVLNAIHGGSLGRIAVTYVEWGGSVVQVMPWTVLDGSAAADQFAEDLLSQPISRLPFTSISNAIAYARQLIWSNHYTGPRQVIDISGDGPNNAGAPAPVARNAAVTEGIVIDALPIKLRQPLVAPSISDIDVYYERCVIGGDGAFMLTVTDLRDFTDAIRDKLAAEITGPRLSLDGRSPGFIPVRNPPPYNCFVGEELQER